MIEKNNTQPECQPNKLSFICKLHCELLYSMRTFKVIDLIQRSFIIPSYIYIHTQEGRLKSYHPDQDTFMKCDQMRYIFQHNHL